MKLILIVVGKTSSEYISKISDDYINRIGRYLPFEIKLIPDIKNAKNMSESILKEKEGEQILKLINNDDHLVLLDDKGTQYTSLQFANWIATKQNTSTKKLTFVIGGAYGFSSSVYDRANSFLSISKMTFSHQIIRAIFLEQLYRAMTIIRNEPYHHEDSLFFERKK